MGELVSELTGFVEELGVDQVNLAQVGLRGLRGYTGAVLHGDACVRVSVHTEAFQNRDALTRGCLLKRWWQSLLTPTTTGERFLVIAVVFQGPSRQRALAHAAMTSVREPVTERGRASSGNSASRSVVVVESG
jgi:hypothetical protein